MEKSANRRRRKAPDFATVQKVWLLRCFISTSRPFSKLDVRRLGPFNIIGQVGTSAFRLDLPPSMQVHDVFHVSLLELHVPNPFPGRAVAPPLAIHVDNIPEFEVQSVLDSKFRYRKLHYFVDWVGYDVKERSWEPTDNLAHAQLAIDDFHARFPLKPRNPV